MVYWGKRRKSVKRNEGTWLATGKKNIFSGPETLYSSQSDKCLLIYGSERQSTVSGCLRNSTSLVLEQRQHEVGLSFERKALASN